MIDWSTRLQALALVENDVAVNDIVVICQVFMEIVGRMKKQVRNRGYNLEVSKILLLL